jgi:predicted nucleotidyltransferase
MKEMTRANTRRLLLEQELERCLALLRQHYHPVKVLLFGSMSTGQVGEWSDLDLVVIAETEKRFLDRSKEALLLLRPQVGMDILVYTAEEFEELARERPFFQNEILQKAKVL